APPQIKETQLPHRTAPIGQIQRDSLNLICWPRGRGIFRDARKRMLPFLVLGGATALYILWALTAYPFQVYVRENSIVYINQATDNTAVAVLYVMATCGSLFFSKVRAMVIFGVENLTILLVVMEVKRSAFTSLWCAYAAIASVIILAYFWRSSRDRPFLYAEHL
ncbi:MAG: DUF6629 family protein, partial [Methylocella sp.]